MTRSITKKWEISPRDGIHEAFCRAIKKILRKLQRGKNLQISESAMMVMSNMLADKFDCIAEEARLLLIKSGSGRKTLNSRDI
jgi:histone H3/H4